MEAWEAGSAPGKKKAMVGALQLEPLGTVPMPPPDCVGGSLGRMGLSVRMKNWVGWVMGMGSE
jgi:hypothetical protein